MKKEITDIAPQKRNRQRVNISLDGEYAFSLDRFTAAWLTIGRELDDAAIKKLLEKDELEAAYARAMHYLSFRSRSALEIERFLQTKGYNEEVSARLMQRLEEEGLVNDVSFARDWVDSRVSFRPTSISRMQAELRHKGLADAAISAAFAETSLEDDALVLASARKLARRYQSLSWEEYSRKLNGALLRRGFSFATISGIARKVWLELGNA